MTWLHEAKDGLGPVDTEKLSGVCSRVRTRSRLEGFSRRPQLNLLLDNIAYDAGTVSYVMLSAFADHEGLQHWHAASRKA